MRILFTQGHKYEQFGYYIYMRVEKVPKYWLLQGLLAFRYYDRFQVIGFRIKAVQFAETLKIVYVAAAQ